MTTDQQEDVPYIAASKLEKEITFKAVILGVLLAIVMAGATTYLGLKMGYTFSAALPASIIAIAVLRAFRHATVLESNVIKTIASAGSVIAGGIVFTIPALVLMNSWQEFSYWQTTTIAIVGGILGILFSVPLRRTLIVEQNLRFPEGFASAEVLKAGDRSPSTEAEGKPKTDFRFLMLGSVISSIIKVCQTGLHILGEEIQGWFYAGGAVFGLSAGFSLSLVGVGYIVGAALGISLLLGAGIAWLVIVPLYTSFGTPQDLGLPADASALSLATAVRTSKLLYIGVGTMMFGGIYLLFPLAGMIRRGVSAIFISLRRLRAKPHVTVLRTERDIPMMAVVLGILILSIPILIIFHNTLSTTANSISSGLYWLVLSFLTLFTLIVGFICASIGSYMAGLVGSSVNPVSGITISTILAVSAAVLLFFGGEVGLASSSLSAMTIMIGGIAATNASVSSENVQCMKSGTMLGATPWVQQISLMTGVVAGSAVMSPTMQVLHEAYGISCNFPNAGMDPTQSLAAPHATLITAVAKDAFTGSIDWFLILIGAGIGLIIAVIDYAILARRNVAHRLSVMAVALGLYLPLEVLTPLIMGGFLNFFALKRLRSPVLNIGENHMNYLQIRDMIEHRGLLFAAGLIAGESIIAIALAIPFATFKSTKVLSLVGHDFHEIAMILGAFVFFGTMYYFYRIASGIRR